MFFFNDCTGEINLSLRLRNVCCYIFYVINRPCEVFDEYYYSFIGLNVLFCFNWVNKCRLCNTFIS